MLFGELFSAEAESAYDSQADRDVANGAGNRAGGGVALRGLAIARLGGGDDGDGGGFGVITAGALVGIGGTRGRLRSACYRTLCTLPSERWHCTSGAGQRCRPHASTLFRRQCRSGDGSHRRHLPKRRGCGQPYPVARCSLRGHTLSSVHSHLW